jgi:uncharacterized membrane protein
MHDADIVFDALLEPNRPMRPLWLCAILGGVAGLSFSAGILFAQQGAWPVIPFFGADVLLLGLAFVLCARRAKRRERLTLTPRRLVIERIAPDGRSHREEIDPYWLRVEHRDPERIGSELALVSRGRRVVVGSFLGPDERAAFADALREALHKARNTLPN